MGGGGQRQGREVGTEKKKGEVEIGWGWQGQGAVCQHFAVYSLETVLGLVVKHYGVPAW